VRNLRTEDEIIANWKGDINHPVVSICCTTYNHEKYIAEAIDSFLMQETDFPFEIIVRDDASLDNTASIIREYEKKYPNIIKPIYEKENGYQRGIKPMPECFEKAKGTYVALCEGDDYWTFSKKLQLQRESFSKFENIDLIFHPAIMRNDIIGGNEEINRYGDEVKVFPVDALIKKGGGYCPTASLMIRRKVVINMPKWFDIAPAGDTYFQILGAARGGALYIPDNLACYRAFAQGSVSQAAKKYSIIKVLKYLDRDDEAMQGVNDFFDGKYNESVIYRRAEFCRTFATTFLINGDYDGYQRLIKRSWSINSRNSFIQTVMYYFSKHIVLLKYLYFFKKKFIG